MLSESLANLAGEIVQNEVRSDLSNEELYQALQKGLVEILCKLPAERSECLSITLLPQLIRIDKSDTREIKRCLGYMFLLSLTVDILNIQTLKANNNE